MKSKTTKKYFTRARIFNILSILATVLPLIIYVILAYIEGAPMEKFTLGCTVIVAGCLVALNFVFKYKIRSVIWILLLGICYCLKDITYLILTIAVTTIIDEFIFTPLAKKNKQKGIINQEIDKRSN